jgi:peptide/nickel transport system ATP-binding protein
MTLLAVEDLTVTLDTIHGLGHAVRNLSFELMPGNTLGIVGESGCGKSMTALAILGLLPENAVTTGAIRFDHRNLLVCSEQELCQIRGNRISMVFQEPMTSLNPVHTIGQQIIEIMILHQGISKTEAKTEAIRLLDVVGIRDPKSRFSQYPHQLSGGQRQRVMIAIALANKPDLLIADEPTTAVDVTIQKQILKLIRSLVDELGMALILISHDLGVIANMVDQIIVMYGGTAVEVGAASRIFSNVSHPYTQGLMSAIPRIDGNDPVRQTRLKTIPGVVPELTGMPTGCTFSDRCAIASSLCIKTPPPATMVNHDHYAACHHLDRASRT